MGENNVIVSAIDASLAELDLLRGAMFDVYATAHNDGDVMAAVERMRDAMEQPWSVDGLRAARTALAKEPNP